MSPDIILHAAAACMYLAAIVSIVLSFSTSEGASSPWRWVRHVWLLATLAVHAAAICKAGWSGGRLQSNWALTLSAVVWLGLLVAWAENNFLKLDSAILPLSLCALPACALACAYPTSRYSITLPMHNGVFQLHFIVAFIAFSFILIAALQALLISLLDRFLRHPPRLLRKHRLLRGYLEVQPPLLMQERLLFRFIALGLLCLTMTLITGLFINHGSEEIFILSSHRVIYSLIAWVVFAVLLFGRMVWGWRGRAALSWTWAGFAFLFLTYLGSQIISEFSLN